MVTSSLYHVCESLQVKFLGFNHGRWHHMDNVFAVTALLLNIANFAQGPRPSAFRELRNSLATSVVVCFQVASPWNLMHTILPLAAGPQPVVGCGLVLVESRFVQLGQSFLAVAELSS
ncbi:Mitogen-activated protein kinase kinase kinase A [Durusdinium trenchii]|uniref:Mitogen-activated protein kinase kinase kinase A n=1 Tax=Durusdinium trenchii TaxID=1381693 RepID=A0ABP0NBA1_9DINO